MRTWTNSRCSSTLVALVEHLQHKETERANVGLDHPWVQHVAIGVRVAEQLEARVEPAIIGAGIDDGLADEVPPGIRQDGAIAAALRIIGNRVCLPFASRPTEAPLQRGFFLSSPRRGSGAWRRRRYGGIHARHAPLQSNPHARGMIERPPITGATKVLAIFGRPVGHALSPLIHNAALAASGADVVFVAFSPSPDRLETALRGLVAAGCAGLSITIPFKTDVVPMLDELGESARATGAVNTVVVSGDSSLSGHNTDVDGVLRCLAALPVRQRERAVLLGAGGAARAAVAALAHAGVEHLTILNRTVGNADALVASMAGSARQMTMDAAVLNDQTLARHTADAQLLVNTTSVGMYPYGDDTPVPAALLHPDLDVIDAIYRPEPTRLCFEARAAGARAVTGVDWIIAQGVMALKYWLGLDADEAAMRAELARFLAQQT